jgi:hypothetical protein
LWVMGLLIFFFFFKTHRLVGWFFWLVTLFPDAR